MPEPSTIERPPCAALALGAAACLLYLAGELYLLAGLGFPLDDSWIHLHFARELASSNGLAYNPGERATGSTAPLWTALLAPGFLLPGLTVVWSKLLGCLFLLLTIDASARLAGELGLGGGLQRLAAALVAANHWLVWSALSGLEIGLFAWLSLWGLILHLRERAAPERLPLSLPVLAISSLARPEGYLLLVLAFVERLVYAERSEPGLRLRLALPNLRGWRDRVLPAALVLAPTLLFYRIVGGSFLPSTFAVKAGPPGDLLPSGAYLQALLGVFFQSQPVMLLLAGAGALRLIEALGGGDGDEGRRSASLLPALWLVGFALVYSLLAAPSTPRVLGNFGRYAFPLLPVLVVLGVLGLERAARCLRPGRLLAGMLVALLLAPNLWGLYRGPLRYLQTVANVEDSDVAAARWLQDRLPPEALLAVQDIGALKYFLPNRVLDLAGIVSPEVLPALKQEAQDPVYWEQRLLRILENRRPDYLVVFPNSYPMLTGGTPGFDKIRSFEIADNVTMAGTELAIFRTPWTRHALAELGPLP